MKRIILVYAVWVSAQFIVYGWNKLAPAITQASVDSWRENYQAAIDKEFPGE